MCALIEEFLTGTRPVPVSDRILATVLFTDIVGSTERLATLGDQAWRALLDRHDAMVRSRPDHRASRARSAEPTRCRSTTRVREDPIAHGNRRLPRSGIPRSAHTSRRCARREIGEETLARHTLHDVLDEEEEQASRLLEIMFSEQHEGRGLDEREGSRKSTSARRATAAAAPDRLALSCSTRANTRRNAGSSTRLGASHSYPHGSWTAAHLDRVSTANCSASTGSSPNG